MMAKRKGHSKPPMPPKPTAEDYGTAHRAQHNGGIVLEPIDRALAGDVTRRRARVRFECRLDWYHSKGAISDAQWVAGMKLRALWLGAHGAPRVIGTYGSVRFGSGGLDEQIERQERYDKAIKLVSSALRDVAVTVCGLDTWAGSAERTKGLRDALNALAMAWRIPEAAR